MALDMEIDGVIDRAHPSLCDQTNDPIAVVNDRVGRKKGH